MKKLLLIVGLVVLSSCASKSAVPSSAAQSDLEDKYNPLIGKATKADFVEEFGQANWCRPAASGSGEESCRFYKRIGTKWMGEKDNRTHRETFDEMFTEFDSNGTLKSFKANAQR